MSTPSEAMTTERLQRAWKESHDALKQADGGSTEKSQPTYANRETSQASSSEAMTTERLQRAWKESHDALKK